MALLRSCSSRATCSLRAWFALCSASISVSELSSLRTALVLIVLARAANCSVESVSAAAVSDGDRVAIRTV
jgi:hypothetical protein